jgi:mannose/fructose/N-acetylgalactosamine-specific phosphotransferase system component IIB
MTSRYCPLLARIDDRLIHGQVVVGCCEPLGARRILLVDESVASDALQQKIYRAGVPPDVRVDFVSVGGAPELMHQIEVEDGLDCVVVVVARAAVMEDLRTTGVEFASVQLGGAHARAGATHEVVPGFFLDEEDRRALRSLLHAGVEVVIQPVWAAAIRPMTAEMLEEPR